MRVLFDQGIPVPLRHALKAHVVETTYERGWSTLDNGELLEAAEQDGFDLLVTTDLNLKHQQNLDHREICILVLTTPSWPRIQRSVDVVIGAVEEAAARSYIEIEIP